MKRGILKNITSILLLASSLSIIACKGFKKAESQGQLVNSNDFFSHIDTGNSQLNSGDDPQDHNGALDDSSTNDSPPPTSPPISPPTPPEPDDPLPPVPEEPSCEEDQMLFQEKCLDEFVIHMAPNGRDSRDGLTRSKAVLSLQRVQKILKEHDPSVPVVVLIQPGTYTGQKVSWTYYREGQDISFKAADKRNRPVFNGCPSVSDCATGAWFSTRIAPGAETNFTFWYLHIKNYRYAISINSNRHKPEKFSAGNTIYGCKFERIGNIANPLVISPSTGAVVLVNSVRNTIINNHFIDVINTVKGGLIHAIYLAHQASENRIERNRFVNSTGDVIRIRDFSNHNIVRDNFYQRTTPYAATFWYCDQTSRNDCTKRTPECPSYGNVVGGNYNGNDFNSYRFYLPPFIRICDPIPNGEQRIITE